MAPPAQPAGGYGGYGGYGAAPGGMPDVSDVQQEKLVSASDQMGANSKDGAGAFLERYRGGGAAKANIGAGAVAGRAGGGAARGAALTDKYGNLI